MEKLTQLWKPESELDGIKVKIMPSVPSIDNWVNEKRFT